MPARKKKTTTGTDDVDALMRGLAHPFLAEMEAVRKIILGADARLGERVKWNAPSFFYRKDLAAFTPRRTEHLLLVVLFPTGVIPDDPSGLLEGDFPGRRLVTFHGPADVEQKRPALLKVIHHWVAEVDRAFP